MSNYLIIGGTSTIGHSVAQKLLNLDHHVYMTGRDLKKTENIAQELNIPFSIIDASDFIAVESVFERAIETMGSLDGVVNCAGSLLLKSAHLTSKIEYENIILSNLTTSFAVTRSAGKFMTKGGGSIVLISSAAALTGISNHEAIACAKSGIIGLTLSAAATYAPYNLRFNAVAPGLVETNLTTPIIQSEPSRKASQAMHALGRLGKPEDIASAIIFFLLPENNWITGQVLAVDGGLGSIKPKIKI